MTATEQRFTTTQFKQLLNTVDLYTTQGWNEPHPTVTNRTRIVPLVVVPDARIPSAGENAVFVKGIELVQKYNENPNLYRVHVPA